MVYRVPENTVCPLDTITLTRKEVIPMTTKRKVAKDFAKGTVVLYNKTYAVAGLTDTIKANLTLHGLVQKLVDATAGMNNKDYTDQERSAKIEEVYVSLKAGNWTKPGEGKSTMKKKLEEAKEKATPAELAVLKKLGLA